jgi:putative ABC transport system substrate-binding protein
MNNRRKLVIALGAGALAAPIRSFAQQSAKTYRIGVLDAASASSRADRIEYLRGGLRDLGYLENKNLALEFRWAEGKYDRLPALAEELIRAKVDLLVTAGTPCTIAAGYATSTIPIVMVGVGDPIASGIVKSLARPAGNITGLAILSPELMSKRLELLIETQPRARQVAFLFNSNNPAHTNTYKFTDGIAKSRKIALQKFEARDMDEVKSAFTTMNSRSVSAVLVPVDTMYGANRAVIAVLAEQQRLPSFGDVGFAEAGGMVGFGIVQSEMYRRIASYIDKILRGAKPANLPVEQPTRFETIVNIKTAKALGIKIPKSILVRADTVIE